MRRTSARLRRAAALGALCLVAAPVALAGCTSTSAGSNTTGTGPTADLGDPVDATGKAEVTVDVVDNAFTPRVIKVSPGTKVTFHNTGVNAHNVTPRTDGDFNALTLGPGQSGSITAPQSAKDERFYCTLHAGADAGVQRGAIVVAAP